MWVMKRPPLTAKTKFLGVASYQARKLSGRWSELNVPLISMELTCREDEGRSR